MTRKVSIIICTRNRAQFIGDTVKSFIDLHYPKDHYEIIIVDNNSTDNTKSLIKKFSAQKKPSVRYLSESRLGNHYGRNTAAKKAKFEMLYFADDDVIVDKNMLTELMKVFDLDEEVATATGRVLPIWEIEPPRWVKKYCNNKLFSLMDPPEDLLITKNINFLYSCHQAIRKDVYFEIEGFNPEIFGSVWLGDGESGINSKIRQAGYKFGYNGKSIVHHIISASRMNQKFLNHRLTSYGAANAYSEFRSKQPTQFQLSLMIMKIIVINLPRHLFYYFFRIIISRDLSLSRFFIAYTFYYTRKARYHFCLLRDKNWQKFALKKDWLTNDSEFEKEIVDKVKKFS